MCFAARNSMTRVDQSRGLPWPQIYQPPQALHYPLMARKHAVPGDATVPSHCPRHTPCARRSWKIPCHDGELEVCTGNQRRADVMPGVPWRTRDAEAVHHGGNRSDSGSPRRKDSWEVAVSAGESIGWARCGDGRRLARSGSWCFGAGVPLTGHLHTTLPSLPRGYSRSSSVQHLTLPPAFSSSVRSAPIGW